MAEDEGEQIPDTDTSITTEVKRQKYYENLLQFQSDVINPKTEEFFQFLNRDSDLGNIDDKTWLLISDRISFANELLNDGFNGAAMKLFSECQSLLVISRSRAGFQQNILVTSIGKQTQTVRQDVSQTAGGGGGLMGMFRRKKR